MQEIELKAWDYDTEKTEKALKTFATFAGTSFKSDRYFIQQNPPQEELRLRTQKDFKPSAGSVQNGEPEENCTFWVTHKKRFKQNGIEQNEETEFSVSDGAAFEKVLYTIGFKLKRTKEKKTGNWYYRNFHIETVELTGLGNFVEIETVLHNPGQEETAAAKQNLLKILQKCRIDAHNIEEKSYSRLLEEKNL